MAESPATAGSFRHVGFFYRAAEEYATTVAAFLGDGVAAGEPAFAAVPESRLSLIADALGADARRVEFADMTEMGRNPARIIPEILTFASKHRGQPVCCIGEPIWPGRTAAEIQEATRHEALINLAFRDSPVTFLCPYDRTALAKSVIADAASTHPAVIRDWQETASATYLGPAEVPPRCDRPLPRPPAHAETLGYRDDLRQVRRFVATKAKGAGLAPPRIHDLVIAIGELAGNTLRHTGGGGTVQVWRTSEEVIGQVADTGHITDPLARYRGRSAELLGGNGLWLVNQVCDLVQTRTGQAGTTTRLHMRLNRP